MTFTELVNLAKRQYGMRYKLNDSTLLTLFNELQAIAFDDDIDAYLMQDEYLTVLQEVTMDSSGYTDAVANDIGKTVTDGSVTGALRYYNNNTRKWAIETSGTFSGSITITSGTGAGTFSSQAIYMGPYTYPSLARKVIGITDRTDVQIFGLSPNGSYTTDDYGMVIDSTDDRTFFYPVKPNDINRQATFVKEPSTEAETYRWWAWRRPPTLTSVTDETNWIIPPEFHFSCLEVIGAMGRSIYYGETLDYQKFEYLFARIREKMQDIYRPVNNEYNDWQSEGQL